MLHRHRLTIGYRSRIVAHSLTATLPPASLTALIGRNGSGKSTLLRTVCGLQRPLAGKVSITDAEGKECQTGPKTVAVVLPPSRYQAPALTVEDTVALGRLPYTNLTGRLSPADHHAIDHAIGLCRIAPLRHRILHTLSDGERQRVMLARALAQDTPVIILDEPSAFLDYSARMQVMMLLRHLCDTAQKTILFSTHDLETALPAVDRVWAMEAATDNHGQTVSTLKEDTPQNLIANGTILRIFPEFNHQNLTAFHSPKSSRSS